MNELTKSARNPSNSGSSERTDAVVRWLTPLLLAFVGATSMGGYNEATRSSEYLHKMNESMAETNRLAEMRGSIQAEIAFLKDEVTKIRIKLAGKRDAEDAKEEYRLALEVTRKLREDLETRAGKEWVLELTSANRSLITTLATSLDGMATAERVNALAKRIDLLRLSVPKTSK